MKPAFRQPRSTGALATIAGGPYELTMAPGFGGRIVSFRRAGRDITRPTPDEVLAEPSVYGFGGFPLMPYSGPLFGPGFTFAGVVHGLDRNVAEEPSATHGEAWIDPFEVEERGPGHMALRMEHVPRDGTFPFRFVGRMRLALSDAGLEIGLSVTSSDHRPMPAGIGLHPYFPRPPGTMLRFRAVGVWPADAPEAVATGCQPLAEGLSFCAGADVSAMVVDRLYEGWDGHAELVAPDGFRTTIAADGGLDKLQLYSPWDYPYVCVEPVSNANDGFNRMAAGVASHGVRVLEPGRSIAGTIRIRASAP